MANGKRINKYASTQHYNFLSAHKLCRQLIQFKQSINCTVLIRDIAREMCLKWNLTDSTKQLRMNLDLTHAILTSMGWYHGWTNQFKVGWGIKISAFFKNYTIKCQILHWQCSRCNMVYCQCWRYMMQHQGEAISVRTCRALLYVSNQQAMIGLINHPCQAFY